jgi:glycosyltransferase involved in cell wall biosynthesis
MTAKHPHRVLVVFNTVCFYGMERSVMETFQVLRPDVEPTFLLNRANARYRTPLLAEMERSGMAFRFFSDTRDWPRFGKPRSWRQAFGMIEELVRGNLDVWRAAKDADTLYFSVTTSAYLAVLAALWFRLRGRKVIYCFHDLPGRSALKLRPAVALSTDLVHCARHSLESAAAAHPFVLDRPNSVIAPPVLIRQSEIADGAGSGGRDIIFLGQVAPHKGVDLLIEAFATLAAQYGDIHLRIAGGVYDENRAWFQGALMASPHRDRIHYLGYRDDVHEILKGAYVLAIPTRPSRFHESFGRVAAEAMAAGVPSVCFRSGALQELVVDGETGCVCSAESSEALAAGLERLIARPAVRDLYGRNARLRYERYYSEATLRREWLDLLTQGASA